MARTASNLAVPPLCVLGITFSELSDFHRESRSQHRLGETPDIQKWLIPENVANE